MPKKLNWTDTEDIAFALIDAHPTMDPLKVRFTDLHKYVTKLEGFGGDPKKSNEKILEAIQMTWHEERQDMEDELGPTESGSANDEDDEDLDEDNYSSDRFVDDEEESGLDDDGDEENEDDDEFGDGFQEEEGDD